MELVNLHSDVVTLTKSLYMSVGRAGSITLATLPWPLALGKNVTGLGTGPPGHAVGNDGASVKGSPPKIYSLNCSDL